MLPVSRILCATDFSDPSHEGVKAAVELAEQFSAALTLVHVIPPMPAPHAAVQALAATNVEIKNYMDTLETTSREELDRLISQFAAKAPQATGIIATGEPADEIVNHAEQDEIDLIVLSTHGRSGWKRLVTGSVAEKVVRLAQCAVLTIHRKDEDEQQGGVSGQQGSRT